MATVYYSLAFVTIDYLHFMQAKMNYGQIDFSLESQNWFILKCCITDVQGKQVSLQSSTFNNDM